MTLALWRLLPPGCAAARQLSRGVGSTSLLRGARCTDKQIEEISKYDALLAEQIRTARKRGVAVDWKELEGIEVDYVPQWRSPMEPSPSKPSTLADENRPLSLPGRGMNPMSFLQTLKDKLFGEKR
mmetsp:Transcript_45377/g.120343  ORF Transcript_45377/g.120343 Transcript_45377/m.120343 type:complete len:126 (-) Transcript_45377:235-612(-)